jgi:hypothetical protein
MTCLDNCNKDQYHFVFCNDNYNGYKYVPNSDISTCQRENIEEYYKAGCDICKNAFDCCSDNISDCCKRTGTPYPTSPPSSQPTLLCGKGEDIHYFQESDMCHFLETRNTDITTMFDKSMMCCSSKRNECCLVKTKEILIGSGCFVLFVILCLYTRFSQDSRKVVPDTQPPIKKDMNHNKILPV